MFDLRKLLGIGGAGQVAKGLQRGTGVGAQLGGHGPVQNPMDVKMTQFQPMQYAQYKNLDGTGGGFGPNNPSQLRVGGRGMPVINVEGMYPQDQGMGELNMNNYVQPSYQNHQTSIHGGFQQNQGINSFGNPVSPQMQPTSDPTGWLRRQIRY